MIVTRQFCGDGNDEVKLLQHGVYGDSLMQIADEAKTCFFFAEAVIKSGSETVTLLAQVTGFDHRGLQNAHDLIAAEFRRCKAVDVQPVLPYLPVDEKRRVLKMWQTWLRQELESLCRSWEFVRHVAEILAFQNQEQGFRAERALRAYLLYHYMELGQYAEQKEAACS